MNKVLEILKIIKTYFLIVVIGVLLVIIYFKNNKIGKLNSQLTEAPKIEYVYNTTIDTIKVPVPKPVQIIKWNNKIDTLYIPIDLTTSDSSKIATAYKDLFSKFAETKVYDNVLKDDSTAFLRLNETVQYNSITDREYIFMDRTPTVTITNTKFTTNTSIVAGIEAGTAGIGIGVGLVTKKNNFFKASYDVYSNEYSIGGYFSIINFKSRTR